ncbi:MAG: 6-phosphogluconolactonase [Gammaproteobacteria bacterium]|nr:6-phosphogluconolactonase [Gammaproteobacteria bacterium]
MLADSSPVGWQRYDDVTTLVHAVCDLIEARLHEAIASKNEFHLVFPGGRSVVPVLEELERRCIFWSGVHLYMTDERCVEVDDVQRNDRLVDDYLLSKIDTAGVTFHRIPAELGPEKGAALFEEELAQLPVFDLVILGIGEDGHTASLFSDSLVQEATQVLSVVDSPKPPPERVSLGYGRLTSARERIVLVMGEGKSGIVEDIRAGDVFPVTRVQPDTWFVTADAYGM